MRQIIGVVAVLLLLPAVTSAQEHQTARFDSLISVSVLLSEQALFGANFRDAEKHVDISHFEEFNAFQISHELKLTIQNLRIQSFKSILLRRDNDWDEGLQKLLELRSVATKMDDKSTLGDYFDALSSAYRATGRSDSAFYFENRALQLYEEAGNAKKVAQVRGRQISRRHNNFQAADNSEEVIKLIPEYQKEIEFARGCGNKYVLAYNTRHLAQIHRQQTHNYQEALRLFQISLELREEIGFRIFLPASYSSVGDVCIKLGQNKKAADMYLRAIALADEIGFARYQFDPRIKLGDLYRDESNFSEARRHYVEALKAASKNNHQEEIDAALEKLEHLANR